MIITFLFDVIRLILKFDLDVVIAVLIFCSSVAGVPLFSGLIIIVSSRCCCWVQVIGLVLVGAVVVVVIERKREGGRERERVSYSICNSKQPDKEG